MLSCVTLNCGLWTHVCHCFDKWNRFLSPTFADKCSCWIQWASIHHHKSVKLRQTWEHKRNRKKWKRNLIIITLTTKKKYVKQRDLIIITLTNQEKIQCYMNIVFIVSLFHDVFLYACIFTGKKGTIRLHTSQKEIIVLFGSSVL